VESTATAAAQEEAQTIAQLQAVSVAESAASGIPGHLARQAVQSCCWHVRRSAGAGHMMMKTNAETPLVLLQKQCGFCCNAAGCEARMESGPLEAWCNRAWPGSAIELLMPLLLCNCLGS
jgi:hypothetical protein